MSSYPATTLLLVLLSLFVSGTSDVYAQTQENGAFELPVPYVSQVPTGDWVRPWDQACEEASITMVEGFYQKKTTIPVTESKQRMQAMIDWEDKTFGKNDDTNAEETMKTIEAQSSFEAEVVRQPSLEDIRDQLDAQHPVIFLVDMFQFYQETPGKDSFHVGVIVGYDDEKKEFIVNDPARERRRYPYEVMMKALHDYNSDSKEADGVPTVIFTHPREVEGPSRLETFFRSIIEWFKRWFV